MRTTVIEADRIEEQKRDVYTFYLGRRLEALYTKPVNIAPVYVVEEKGDS